MCHYDKGALLNDAMTISFANKNNIQLFFFLLLFLNKQCNGNPYVEISAPKSIKEMQSNKLITVYTRIHKHTESSNTD